MSQPKPRIAVLYSAPVLPSDHPVAASEAQAAATARCVLMSLKAHGLRAWLSAVRPPIARLVRTLMRRKPDVVFNLVEGFGVRSEGASHVASLLELMGLAYTGCPPLTLALGQDQARARALLLGSGLPTMREPEEPGPPGGSGIVGPSPPSAPSGEASPCVGTGSAFRVMVLALPEPTALPVVELVAGARAGTFRCPAAIEPARAERLGRLAVSAFQALGCRDQARVDFRLDAQGEPLILGVDPSPDLLAEPWRAALRASGRDVSETIIALARQALARGAGRAGSGSSADRSIG
ncbi:MAG: hypothetical protein IRY99_18715 [Isosphaeraceae bacterium]|nr:hypothetical protein [Isosphaeraceae bacterium]